MPISSTYVPWKYLSFRKKSMYELPVQTFRAYPYIANFVAPLSRAAVVQVS
jgi:hypothetical protein